MGKMLKRLVAWLLMGWMICLCGCQGKGYMGGLGGVLPRDFRQSGFSVCVRGEVCRTAADGYTPPDMTPMAGMGVSMKDTPLSFEAEIWVDEPIDSTHLRNFSVKYTAPTSLAGLGLVCRVTANQTKGTWDVTYTLSRAGNSHVMYDLVLFVERTGELRYAARLRTEGPEPKRKRV